MATLPVALLCHFSYKESKCNFVASILLRSLSDVTFGKTQRRREQKLVFWLMIVTQTNQENEILKGVGRPTRLLLHVFVSRR